MARLSTVIIAAIAVSVVAADASAQNQTRRSSIPVALVDVGFVFKNYKRFSDSLDKMKQEVQAFEQKLTQERDRLRGESQALQEFKPGSPEYKQKEETMARQLADMRVEMEFKRKEMLEREAKLYHAVYQSISAVVRQIANERQIGLVLRFDSEQGDPTNRASVMRYVNRTAVYSHPSLDITQEVLQRLAVTRQAQRTTPRRPPQRTNN